MKLLLCLFFAFCAVAQAGEDQKYFDYCKFSYEITLKDLGQDGWDKYSKCCRKRLEDYLNSPGGAPGADDFLNDRLTDLGYQVNDIKSLKKFVAWLALYHVWDIPLPPRAAQELKVHETKLCELSKDFSWEKLLTLSQKDKKK